MKNMVRATIVVDNQALNNPSSNVRGVIYEKLMFQIAKNIVMGKMVEEVGEFSTTFGITLVVKTPDEYYKDVQRAAMEYVGNVPQFMGE